MAGKLKPLMSDAEIKRRKQLQGRISVTTSTLGLSALALKGGGAAVGRKLPPVAEKLNRAAINTGIASGGIGGVGGYNFAAYTKAESRKRNPRNPVKKMDTLDQNVEIFKGLTPAVNITEHQRRARDSRRTVNRGTTVTGLGMSAAGIAAASQPKALSQAGAVFRSVRHNTAAVGNTVGTNPKAARSVLSGATHNVKTAMKIRPAGSVVAGGLTAAGVGTGMMIGGRLNEKRHDRATAKLRQQRVHKNAEIFKAYDPERSRQRRLDHYATGAAIGAGAAGAGAIHQGLKAKRGGVLKLPRNPVFGGGVRAAGKAGALAGAAVGTAVLSDRIRRYKGGRGGKLTPMRAQPF